MKKIILFLISFVAVLLLAVFLAPLLYQILPYKFERIFNRIVMIGVLICVLVFVRIRKETFQNYGMIWTQDSLRFWLTAFLTPIAVLSFYIGVQVLAGEAMLTLKQVAPAQWISRILMAFGAGLIIGVIEEFFFRGAVMNACRRLWASPNRIGLFTSLLITNLFYSIVHFVHAKKPFVDQTPDFIDGFRLLLAPFSSFGEFGTFWPGFVGLFIFGMMLSGLTLKTKSLYPAMGLHAGAVFFTKTDGLLVDFGPYHAWWGSGRMYDGFIGWVALGVLYLILYFSVSRPPSSGSRVSN